MKTLLPLKTLLFIALSFVMLLQSSIAQITKSTKKKIIKIIEIDEDGEKTTIDTVYSFGFYDAEDDAFEMDFDIDFSVSEDIEKSIDSILKNIDINVDIDFEDFANHFDADILISGIDVAESGLKHVKISDDLLIINGDTIDVSNDSIIDIEKLDLTKGGIWVISDEDNDEAIQSRIIFHEKGKNYQYSYNSLEDKKSKSPNLSDYEKYPIHIVGENGISRDVFLYDLGKGDLDHLKSKNIIDSNYKELNINDLHFYSNKTSHQFTLEFSLKERKKIEIEIYNLSGKKVFTTNVKEGKIKESIDLATFGSGTYFLTISIESQFYLKKIILN